MMSWKIILIAPILLHLAYGQTVRPCVNFMDIPSVGSRNPNTATQPGNTINDRTLAAGWYGAANYELHDSAPGFLRCGSLYPIWRQSISGTTATMCILDTSGTCTNSFTIQVQDCGGYTVYNLTTSPIHQSSYCFREIPANAPTYSPKPTVVHDITDTNLDKSDLLFRCLFVPSSNQMLFHRTMWYVDDVLIHQHPTMQMDDIYFNNTQITQAIVIAAGITKIGFNISCEVEAMFGVGMPPGPGNRADPFFVGFEILTKEITIRQGETGQVQVRATVPFRCGNISESFPEICTMPVEIQTADSTGLVSQEDCSVSIPYTQWNQPASMTVHGTITPTYGRSQLDSRLVLRTPNISPRFPFWTNHTIGTVKVKVLKDATSVRHKMCSCHNDPYVYQFQGRKHSLQEEGRYTLYKLPRPLIEVQIIVRNCTRRTGSCNCGVAIQSGKTVFSINGCDSNSWRIQHQGCDDSDNAMEIRKRSSLYEIYLPTGTRVMVTLYQTGPMNRYLNVYIPGTIQDNLASRGLCGQLSNTTNDDFIMRNGTQASDFNTFFIDSWRVTTGDLFDPDYVQTLTSALLQPPKYCFCEGGENITCSSLDAMNFEVRPNHYKDVPCVVRLNRKKRAVRNRIIDTEHRYRRQTEVWTSQTAAEYCNNLFAASQTVQLCRNVPGVNVDNSRDDCISDILLSGTTDFRLMAIDTVRASCETEVLRNPDLWEPDPNNPGGVSIFDIINSNVCPNDCNVRGTCQRGLCVCNAGFGSADCSVDLTQPPQLDEVEDNGHCDLATSSCQRLTVFGQTFLEDAAIRCRSTKFTVGNSGDLQQTDAQVADAIERSLSEVECPVGVDAVRGVVTAYIISVANTGNIFSEDAMVLVYDSTCVTVHDVSRNWMVRGGFRVENGRCIISNGSDAPTYSPKPTVVHDITDTNFDKSDLLFRCLFVPSSNQMLFHRTTWYVDDVFIHQHPTMQMDDIYFNNTQLTQAMLIAAGITKIGFNISCDVEAMFGVGMPPGPANRADPFFVGFEIVTKEITIRQGETGQVQVRATVPFRCGNISESFSDICTMPVEIQTVESTGRVSQEDCAISIPYTQWNQPASMTVHGTITPTYGRTQLDSRLVLRTPKISSRFPFWANHTIGTVKVKVLKDTTPVTSKHCSSQNDPYVYQFDRRSHSLQQEGRFTLYKLASRLIEIQISVRRCTEGNAHCNCGVALQSGKTVFSINGCDTTSWRIQHQGCDDSDNAMEIRKRSRSYEIYLPTGARVTVDLRSSRAGNLILNVKIPGTILDNLASRGLCGQLSNTENDDFIMRNEIQASNFNAFVNSWRVTTGDLFDPDYVQTLTSALLQPPRYCFCEGGENITCSSLDAMKFEVRPNHYNDVPCAVRLNRKKRAVRNRIIDTEHRHKRQTPTEVWTNQTAAEFCNNLFAASKSVQLCRNVPGVNVNNSRDDCISDILLSGTTDFQAMSIDSVRSSCETEVLLNPELWVPDPNNPGAPSVFDTITNNVCPNDCSGRGTCQGGLCVCNAGFGSADCSVDLTQPPQLEEVEDDGHCDLATSSCQRLTVFGLTFLEDAAIRCRSTKFTVHSGGDLQQPDTRVTDAIERSLSEVECPVRVDVRGVVTAYNISVANTGNIFSEDAMVLVYDSRCVDVDHSSRIWSVKSGFKVQNGRCISNDGSGAVSTSQSPPSPTPIIDVTGPVVVGETTTNANTKPTMSYFKTSASFIFVIILLALHDF